VTCNDDNQIIEIDLHDCGLAGKVTPWIYALPELTTLTLGDNDIDDAGWDKIAGLLSVEDLGFEVGTKLKSLVLTGNKISSVEGIDALADSLKELHLTYNRITGPMPDELFELTNLRVLSISENAITGTIDKRLGTLYHLREFYCYGNMVEGQIPEELGQLKQLQILTFAENQLSGPISSDLVDNLVNLKIFSVHNREEGRGKHNGTIPKFYNHPYLAEIYMDNNAFTGELPHLLLHELNQTIVDQVTVNLANNQLTGSIPSAYLRFNSLDLDVTGNKISSIDSEICESDSIDNWMNGLVELYGCEAILCDVDYYLPTGKQEDDEVVCKWCDVGTDYMGSVSCASDVLSDLQILAEFYLTLDGPNWAEADGWDVMEQMETSADLELPDYKDLDIDHCKFYGVECDDNDRVTELKLKGNSLEGLVPASLFDLPELTDLDLSGNELYFDRDNGFGKIGNAKKLTNVDLSSNDIQTWKGLSAAKSIRELHLDDLYLYSPIDKSLYTMEELTILHMQFSGLKGKIPEGISALKNLKALMLYGNSLTGQVPAELGDMPNLWHITLSENDFTGELPAEAFKNLVNLEKFHIHQNDKEKTGITGKLPSFKKNTKLHMLDVSSNAMTGEIPDDFMADSVYRGLDDQLMDINLSYNKFTGVIHSSTFKEFSNMKLDLANNKFEKASSFLCDMTDELTDWWDGEVGKVIDGGGNGCDAIVCPPGTYNTLGRATSEDDGECVECESATFAGAVTCPDATEDNSREKEILDGLYIATAGDQWSKVVNWTEANICSYEGIVCSDGGAVAEINVTSFGLKGEIPADIWELPSLTKVDFSSNVVDLSFEGIEKATKLKELIMSDADLTNVTGIEKAPPSLVRLEIQRNSFKEKEIPVELFSLVTLKSLLIGFNGFSGSLATDIGKMTELEEFRASNNDIFGILPVEITDLSNLITLDLSGNMLTGKIPDEFQDVTPLRFLHLQGQRDFGGFSGQLPSFENSAHLHDLDLSRNSLTGNISDKFLETVRKSKNRTDYAYPTIDLSHNMITGKIPANWDDFVGLFVDLADNQITEVPDVLCDDDYEFENYLVGQLTENACDAILCRPGYYSDVGRQTDVNITCFKCPEGSTSRFYGSLECESESGERAILDRIYELIFTHASEDQYWGTEAPICNWFGLKCKDEDSTDGVTELSLESNALVAGEDDIEEVSKLLFSLPSLEYLSLRGNAVPLKFDNIGNATKLKSLHLSSTGLESIDGITAAADTLTSLHLTENSLEGSLMSDLFKLTKLEELYISFNKISGPLTGIGALTELQEFYAFKNRLTGTLPAELGSITHLRYFVAGQNKFEGDLPEELNELVKIKDFSVYYQESENGLGGPMLDFHKAKNMAKIDIEGNKFSGKIPSTLLSGLDSDYKASTGNQISLRFAANDFTGVLPAELGSIGNLYLDITGNKITGPIPTAFCSQSAWMEGLVGELDSCDTIACPEGKYSESGRVSDSEEKCRSCASNEVAPFLGSYSCKDEDSEINILKAIYKGTDGSKWNDNSHWNDVSKPICAWYGVTCEGGKEDNHTVTELDLSNNKLRGTILSSIYELSSLKRLDLKDNHVFMTFDKIGMAENLETLYISNIDIGNVDGIGKAPALKELHLTNNDFTGPFPDNIFHLRDTLESLYIAYNSFSGPLSPKFGTMTKLKEFYAYGNEFTGKIPVEIAKLDNLETFVVAENLFSGSLSEDFSSMKSLRLFSAFRRLKAGPKLHGPLPSFSNLPQLEGLYLDYNQFSGPIPDNFLAASLKVDLVTLGHNMLTGKVPKSLASFDSVQLQMEGNRLTGLDKKFCELDEWMDGAVGEYECDAIMCPPHTFSKYGRQNSTSSECRECDGDDQDTTPYFGSLSCDIEIEEKDILKKLYTATGGPAWHNNDGWTDPNADVCDYYGIQCGESKSVMGIRLGANNLKGTPPREIFLLKQLHVLWLHSNPINFKFDGIGKAENLIELRLDATGLSDVTGVGKAESLVKLDLKYNKISGNFPTEIVEMESLETLTLTDNDLTGGLPETFNSDLVVLRLGSNRFSGRLKSFNEMEYLRHLDLSENELTGHIPSNFLELGSMRRPIEVDLSSNKLTGGFPSALDDRFDNLVIYARDNQITKLSTEFCDADNDEWNFRDVAQFGCKGLLCPPGTANYNGRQNSVNNPCSPCASNKDYYGQITCDGLPLGVSPSSRLSISAAVKVISALVVGSWIVWM